MDNFRTVQNWPLTWQTINGGALIELSHLTDVDLEEYENV